MLHCSPAFAIFLAISFGVYRIFVHFTTSKLNFPVVGSAGDPDFFNAALEGFEKYPDTPFLLPSNPNVVILPLPMYMEVKNNPAAHHNLERQTRFMSRWTHAKVDNEEISPVIRRDLAKNIAEILPLIQAETRYAFEKLNASSEWMQIPVQPVAQRMIALLTSSVFVGKQLGRSVEWLNLSTNYTTALGHMQDDYNRLHPIAAQVMAPFLKSVRTARNNMSQARPLLQPLVSKTLSAVKEGKGTLPAGSPGALISWLLSYIPAKDRTATRIAEDRLGLAVAAIHNTSNTTALALINLAEHPEYIDDLRSEIEVELARERNWRSDRGEGYLGKSNFANMKKLDSFIKENMRSSGIFSVNPLYKMTANTTFSNGVKLPKGTRVGFSTHGVSMSTANPTLDPVLNSNTGNPGPEVFDGYRFEKLRQLPAQESKYQAVTTGLTHLSGGMAHTLAPDDFSPSTKSNVC